MNNSSMPPPLKSQKIKLILIDDHVLFREGLASIIRSEPDIEIAGLAGTVRDAGPNGRQNKAGYYFDGLHVIGWDWDGCHTPNP